MKKTISHLKETNSGKIEKIFFTLFLLSIPLQTRLTFYTPQTYLNASFNEYTTFFIYFSDILLIITLLIYFVNILTFNNFIAIIKHGVNSFPHLIPIIFILIALITWSFITIPFAEYKNLAFYQFIKILELALLFLYLNQRFQWFGINRFFALIFISGTFESIIGITQYYFQKSLGLRILMESVLSPEIPNVAKIVVDGERIIRVYGTFPHPNVFSGFLILSIFCGIWLLFSRKTPKPYKIVSRETILYGLGVIGLIVQLNAFVLTFSRTAWLASILIIPIFILLATRSKLFHVKQFINFISQKTITLLIFSIVISLLVVISINWQQISSRTDINENKTDESIDNRVLYNNIAMNIIKQYPLTGIGGKNFTAVMQRFNNVQLEQWQFQPAHSVYLLIASELGIIGLILFLLFVYLIIGTTRHTLRYKINLHRPTEIKTQTINSILNHRVQNVSRETFSDEINESKSNLKQTMENRLILARIGLISILSGFLFIGLFDHYFWTLQQGQLTLWLVLGTLYSRRSDF